MQESISRIVASHQKSAVVDEVHKAAELRKKEAEKTLRVLNNALGEEKRKGQIGNFGVRVFSQDSPTQVDAIILQSPVPITIPYGKGKVTEQTFYGSAVVTREGPMVIKSIIPLTKRDAENIYAGFLASPMIIEVLKPTMGGEPTATLAKQDKTGGSHQLVPLPQHCSIETIVDESIVLSEASLRKRMAADTISVKHSIAARQPVLSRTGVK